MRFPILLVFILALSPFAFAEHPSTGNPDRARSRLLELFIWKTSEELSLPADVEIKYGEIIRNMNERRRVNGDRMEKAIARLDELTKVADVAQPAATAAPAPAPVAKGDNKAINAALDEYRKTLAEHQKLQNDEINQLKAVLPPDKLARYLVAKNVMTEKLKTYLSKPTDAPAKDKDGKPLAEPKVIEEK